MKDQQTHDYFDQLTPHYNAKRFDFALEYLNDVADDRQNVLDIGCGDGATLHSVRTRTPLSALYGLDISERYLEKARETVGCDTIKGSILDDWVVAEYAGKFNYCLMGAVIHHLIGKNRRESFACAEKCIGNAIDLLKPGGSLLIFEPTYGPSALMDLVFWIKKNLGRITSKRVELSRRWMNIGQPVVSYYTPKQLVSFVEAIPGARIVAHKEIGKRRLGLIIYRVSLGIIVQKKG